MAGASRLTLSGLGGGWSSPEEGDEAFDFFAALDFNPPVDVELLVPDGDDDDESLVLLEHLACKFRGLPLSLLPLLLLLEFLSTSTSRTAIDASSSPLVVVVVVVPSLISSWLVVEQSGSEKRWLACFARG